MADLTFDPVREPSTTLAEEYINKHTHVKYGPQKGKCFVFRNSVMVNEELQEQNFHLQLPSSDKVTIDHKIRRKFTTKIKENEELFCQLEYLHRRCDAGDTKKQIQLILQYLQCYDADWDTGSLHYTLLVTADTPLYCLGYIISGIYCGKRLRLLTTTKTAPLCHLFYEVCLHAGIDVPLFIINTEDVGKIDKITPNSKGCTLVLTECADVHSAVDLFLYSSTTAPWKIDRILVQESKIEAVKSAFSSHGKGRRMENDRPRQYEAAFETRRGTVAVTFGNNVLHENNVVRVSTYTTVRELTSLLANPSPRFLSLWCGNLAQAQEIAVKTTASYIWIDNYADFYGPSEISLALYNAPLFYRTVDPHSHNQLVQMSHKWCNLDLQLRKTIVLNAMEKFELKDGLLKAYDSIENWRPKDLALMEEKKLTIVIDCPEKEVIYFESDESILHALELVIRGYCVYIKVCTKTTEQLISEMNNDLVPIMARKEVEKLESDMKVQIKAHHGTKRVIQKTFGTIFAN